MQGIYLSHKRKKKITVSEGVFIRVVKCRDLGINCDFISVGDETGEVKKKMLEHLEKEHLLNSMSEDEIKEIKARLLILLSRSCGCGML